MKRTRKELLEKVLQAEKEQIDQAIEYAYAGAQKFGINVTDFKCLEFLLDHGSGTAGQLAEHAGLTSGAITGVIDRLEKSGLAVRDQDLQDRRKVWVRIIPEVAIDLKSHRRNAEKALEEAYADFSDRDLVVIRTYIERSMRVMREQF